MAAMNHRSGSRVVRDGRERPVKNLGWLLKHWKDVEWFDITPSYASIARVRRHQGTASAEEVALLFQSNSDPDAEDVLGDYYEEQGITGRDMQHVLLPKMPG